MGFFLRFSVVAVYMLGSMIFFALFLYLLCSGLFSTCFGFSYGDFLASIWVYTFVTLSICLASCIVDSNIILQLIIHMEVGDVFLLHHSHRSLQPVQIEFCSFGSFYRWITEYWIKIGIVYILTYPLIKVWIYDEVLTPVAKVNQGSCPHVHSISVFFLSSINIQVWNQVNIF